MVLIFSFIAFLGFILLGPERALAWGPATHLSLAFAALERLSVVKPSLYLLLSKYIYDFLYGCLAPDIVLGKRFARYTNHCHDWKLAARILKEVASPQNKAFAFGYLSHLAADTVSHNQFVPFQIVSTYTSRTVRHVYWELRFDCVMDPYMWQVAKSVVREAQHRNNKPLQTALEKTFLSFKTAEKVFNGYLVLGRINRWQRLIRYYSTKSKWGLSQKSVDHYYQQSLEAVMELFTRWPNAPVVELDPMGRESLALAKKARRLLRASLKQKSRRPSLPRFLRNARSQGLFPLLSGLMRHGRPPVVPPDFPHSVQH